MSKYTLEVEELQKAVALLTHVDSKLDVLSKRITAAYHRLDNQQGSAIEKAQSDIYYQGSIYDEQWNYIKYIKTILQTILDESLKAETEAKKIMESEWVEESKKEENKQSTTGTGEGGGGSTFAPKSNIVEEMRERYQRLLKNTNRVSFSGACSAFVYRQLWDQGILDINRDGGVQSGKNYYRVWSQKSTTSTGYSVDTYGGSNALKDLMRANVGKTLKNIAISFDYDGKNYLSREHGHVMLISEIRDGKVYYMESAAGRLYNLNGRAYAEGEPICLSLSDFLKQYPNMNGAVHFYK